MKGETLVLLLRLGFSLSLIFGLMWVAAKVLRTKSGRRGGVPDHLEVIERKPLTKNSSIAIVRVGDETLTVGITDTHVSLLGQVAVELDTAHTAHTAHDAGAAAIDGAAATPSAPAPSLDLRPNGARTARETVIPVDGRRGLLDALRDRTVRHIPG